MTPKVSIIVPIYNAGKYLRRCLDTLVNQTLQEIEIICVLDCPTDGSNKVVEEYAAKDKRIIVVRNAENLGISASRSAGLAVARGEYIGFSDHDDYRELDMYESLYQKAIREGSDVVMSPAYMDWEEGGLTQVVEYQEFDRGGVMSSLIMPMEHPHNPNYLARSVWASIYKRDMLDKQNICFLDRNTYFEEDTLFNIEAFACSEKVSYVNKPFYHWVKYEESTSSKLILDIEKRQMKLLEQMKEILQKYGLLEVYQEELWMLVSRWLRVYFPYYKRLSKQDLEQFLREIHYPIWGRHFDLKVLSKKRFMLMWFVFNVKYC